MFPDNLCYREFPFMLQKLFLSDVVAFTSAMFLMSIDQQNLSAETNSSGTFFNVEMIRIYYKN